CRTLPARATTATGAFQLPPRAPPVLIDGAEPRESRRFPWRLRRARRPRGTHPLRVEGPLLEYSSQLVSVLVARAGLKCIVRSRAQYAARPRLSSSRRGGLRLPRDAHGDARRGPCRAGSAVAAPSRHGAPRHGRLLR